MFPRLLMASDCGYLNEVTLARLHACGYPITAAAQSRTFQRKCADLGIKTLAKTLPQWPEAPPDMKISALPRIDVPPDWCQALAASDVVIYASEPRAYWEADAPHYSRVCHVPLQLLAQAMDARVNVFVFISAGQALGFQRTLIAEEWDGNVYQEESADAFEAQRGVYLPEASVQALYSWYLHKRQYSGFWGFLARSPVTQLIWLTPEYHSDPETERRYDATEIMAAIRVARFTQDKYHTEHHSESWPKHSILQALERLLAEPMLLRQ